MSEPRPAPRRAEALADALADWADRYERAGLVGRAVLLGSGAARVAAGVIEHVIERAASGVVGAQDALRKETDPDIVDARIVEEVKGKE